MLTKGTLVTISDLLKLTCFFKILPFHWNPKSFTLTVIPDRKLWITLLLYSVVWLNMIYLIIAFNYYHKKSVDPTSKITHILWMTGIFVGVIVTYSNIVKRYELASFFNKFFLYQQQLRGIIEDQHFFN